MSKFTVKHVDEYRCTEEMFPADYVMFFNKSRTHKDEKDVFTYWMLGEGLSEGHNFEKGSIYVMNDNGKTVAVYHLNQIVEP